MDFTDLPRRQAGFQTLRTKKMYSFFNDYSEGAHPKVLELLSQTNAEQMPGYGEDPLCQKAATLIRQTINDPHADVHFVSGGTQANLTVPGAILRPHEAIIATDQAHPNVHEAGAIEATGHRIIAVQSPDGKLYPAQIEAVVSTHHDEHRVKPRVVFISNSTEVGTVYTKAELEALRRICDEKNLYLYLDGARLGAGLVSSASEGLTMADVARLTDVFYIGGTKNGALLGEAIVITNGSLKSDFRYHLKQRGALLSKGRLLGAQFVTLFENNLHLDLARHANQMAMRLAEGIQSMDHAFAAEPVSNQIFPILPNELIDALQKDFGFYIWEKVSSTHSAIRLVTSWATTKEAVEGFLGKLRSF